MKAVQKSTDIVQEDNSRFQNVILNDDVWKRQKGSTIWFASASLAQKEEQKNCFA